MRVLLIAALVISQSAAANTTGNEMMKSCVLEYDTHATYKALCTGYVLGAVDGLINGAAATIWSAEDSKSAAETLADVERSLNFCFPEVIKKSQIVDVYRHQLRDSPELRHISGSTVLLTALRENFPCS